MKSVYLEVSNWSARCILWLNLVTWPKRSSRRLGVQKSNPDRNLCSEMQPWLNIFVAWNDQVKWWIIVNILKGLLLLCNHWQSICVALTLDVCHRSGVTNQCICLLWVKPLAAQRWNQFLACVLKCSLYQSNAFLKTILVYWWNTSNRFRLACVAMLPLAFWLELW